MKKAIMFGGSFLVFAMVVLTILNIPGKEAISLPQKSETLAPDFTLMDITGKKVSLSDYKGHVVLINFWATWCPPCRAELPDISKLREKYKDSKFEVLGIILERNDPSVLAKVKEMKNKYKLNYPLIWGDNQIVRAYGNISSIPTSFIVDKSGNIVEQFVGARSYDTFEKMILPYLK
ncbi:MAG: hypothetical protein Kow00108_02900 [Calditrichia bacterium]